MYYFIVKQLINYRCNRNAIQQLTVFNSTTPHPPREFFLNTNSNSSTPHITPSCAFLNGSHTHRTKLLTP